jgi:glucose-1-phosphate thymidylyltransferase
MKGLILSGGSGTRLRPLTYTSAKQLIPVANKPVLFYGIEHLVAAGVSDIGIVVGDTAAEIEAAVGDGGRWGASVTYIPQDAPRGLAHAVKVSRDYLGDEPFIMYLGDNILRDGVQAFVDAFAAGGANAQILAARVPEPQRFGVIALDGDRVVRVVEKPATPPSDLALVGVYLFDHNVFAAIETLSPSARGELEITEAIQVLIDRGLTVRWQQVSGWWKDTGHLDDLLEANRVVLGMLEPRRESEPDADSRIEGTVIVGRGTTISHSVVRGPAIIGDGCRLDHADIGPFTSLADGVVIEDATVEHCIVLQGARIEHLTGRLKASLVGRQARVYGAAAEPRAHHLMIGDRSSVGIGE